MKRFTLSLLLLIFGVSVTLAQERHYSYRYIGTNYQAQGGGQTTMTNKLSSARLAGGFIASILPDHKTLWIYGAAINERCTGKGTFKNGGYSYTSPITQDYFELLCGELPTSGYSITLIGNYSRIVCVTNEPSGADYYVTRYDHYKLDKVVSKPNNPLRITTEREDAEREARLLQHKKELAKMEAQIKTEREAREKALKNTVGNLFPMAYFVDSHGNRVDLSYFKRGKKSLVITHMASCSPSYKLMKELKKYPQIADQIITIIATQSDYSKYNSEREYTPNRLYFNSSVESNSKWIYGKSVPCIILVDESGRVMSYKYGYDYKKDVKYIADIVDKMRIRTYAPYKVGDYYFDGKSEGVVFEVYNNGYSGKIVSLKHSDSIMRWRESGKLNIGKSFGVTDGRDIMYYRELAESITGSDAFGWCSKMGAGWYLPTIEELKAIYKNRSLIEQKLTDKLNAVYWSSTEYNANEAYYTTKSAGRVAYSEKHYGCNIRAVKVFGKGVPREKQKQTSAPYKVGDFYNENGKVGVVFEVNADGTSGKISSVNAISNSTAWCADKHLANGIVGANSTTNGEYNMKAIMRVADWQKKYPAFALCTTLSGEGWYIPSVEELRSIYESRSNRCVPLLNTQVWSSTEDIQKEIGAIKLDLRTGKASVGHKDYGCYIYAAAKFGKSDEVKNRTFERTYAPYKVGDLYNDGLKCGVVVEVWDSGKSGKIISLTETLQPLSDAQATCTAMGEGWYLPSAEELRLLSYNKAECEAVNKALSAYGTPLMSAFYWSNTETGELIHKQYPTVYTMSMDGNCSQEPTCNGHYVRAFTLFGTSARPTTTLARPKTSAPYKVGDYYNDGVKDGIVFEVRAGGNHGKIISIAEPLIDLRWSTGDIYGASAKSKSNGAKNMEKIKLLDNWQSRYPAAKWCSDLGEGWYMPSINELERVYMNKSVIENALKCKFKDEMLSSTESNKRPQNKYINDRSLGSVYVLRMSDAHIYRARTIWVKEVRAVARF